MVPTNQRGRDISSKMVEICTRKHRKAARVEKETQSCNHVTEKVESNIVDEETKKSIL